MFPNQCTLFKTHIFFCNASHNSGSANIVFSLSFGGDSEKAFAARRAEFGTELNPGDVSSVFLNHYFSANDDKLVDDVNTEDILVILN